MDISNSHRFAKLGKLATLFCLIALAFWNFYLHWCVAQVKRDFDAHRRGVSSFDSGSIASSVEWLEYSQESERKYLDSGKAVLVYVVTEWSASGRSFDEAFTVPSITELLDQQSIVAMKINNSSSQDDPEVNALRQTIGTENSGPFVIVSSPASSPDGLIVIVRPSNLLEIELELAIRQVLRRVEN